MTLPDPSETSVAATVEGTNLTNLFSVIDKDKVHGLNLTVPEDAKEVIKPWDQRDDNTRHVDSSVDDQVRCTMSSCFHCIELLFLRF